MSREKNIAIFLGGLLSGIGLIGVYSLLKPKAKNRILSAGEKNASEIANSNGGLRPSCLKCVNKHISQAIVLLSESKKGYPEHFWIAMGHLAEAEDESIKEFPELANKIRDAREELISGKKVDLVPFYKEIDSL